MNKLTKNSHKDYKIFFLVFIIIFTVFAFTSHGHRNTPDEYFPFVQARQIATLTTAPDNIPEEIRLNMQLGGHMDIVKCQNGILCSYASIGHAISYVPFVIIAHNFHPIPNFIFTDKDFDDPNYVWWRNSQTQEETFTYLFFGPFITALSSCVLFLIARTYEYRYKTSIIITFLFALTTIAWAYSSTGFNNIESSLFILLGFFFFRKYKVTNRSHNLIFSGLALGFGVLVRPDVVIFAVILLAFLIIEIMKKELKVQHITNFILPLVSVGLIQMIVDFIRFGRSDSVRSGSTAINSAFHTYPFYKGIFGLLFSPGAGLFTFSPILLISFISFLDFYKKNKRECIMILSYFVTLLVFFGTTNTWHGFVSWSARYMISIIPFIVLTFGASIEKRKNKIFRISLVILASIGVFFNFVWLVQDVNWYVWGQMGESKGLYGLGGDNENLGLRLNSAVFWTFQYSQLNQAINLVFTHLQPDLFLLKILGSAFSILLVIFIIIPSSILLSYLVKKNDKNTISNEKESNTSF